jgi:hypothetical protein
MVGSGKLSGETAEHYKKNSRDWVVGGGQRLACSPMLLSSTFMHSAESNPSFSAEIW